MAATDSTHANILYILVVRFSNRHTKYSCTRSIKAVAYYWPRALFVLRVRRPTHGGGNRPAPGRGVTSVFYTQWKSYRHSCSSKQQLKVNLKRPTSWARTIVGSLSWHPNCGEQIGQPFRML